MRHHLDPSPERRFCEDDGTHVAPPCTADPSCTSDEHLFSCPTAPHADLPPTLSTATSTEEHP